MSFHNCYFHNERCMYDFKSIQTHLKDHPLKLFMSEILRRTQIKNKWVIFLIQFLYKFWWIFFKIMWYLIFQNHTSEYLTKFEYLVTYFTNHYYKIKPKGLLSIASIFPLNLTNGWLKHKQLKINIDFHVKDAWVDNVKGLSGLHQY